MVVLVVQVLAYRQTLLQLLGLLKWVLFPKLGDW
jgi:hypothetical protein